MKQFFIYLKEHIGSILLFLGCIVIFVLVFAMYHLPIGAVLYPAALCLAFIACFSLYKCFRQRKKHKELVRLQALPENLIEVLSVYDKQLDVDYRSIMEGLCEREAKLREADSLKMSDMIDYYTTWVHQIKTPIASMRLTLQNEDTPLARKLLEELFRIEQYVEMVLCYLRLDSDSTDYVFRECSVDKIVKGALRKFAGQFIAKGIHLEYTEVDRSVITDEKWLAFVLEQIISNALKYTPSGSIYVYPEDPATLCIRDTGIGIAADDLPRIFEKGYTGYNGRTDKKASGLGLYLCNRICNNLGHRITVESTVGVGTTVKINLMQKKTSFE